MKNTITILTLLMIFTVSMLSSCKNAAAPANAKVEKILNKYEQYGKLEKKDYPILLDYTEQASDEALPLLEEINHAANDGDSIKIEELKIKFDQVKEKYPHYEKARDILLRNAMSSNVDDETYKRIIKLRNKLLHTYRQYIVPEYEFTIENQ